VPTVIGVQDKDRATDLSVGTTISTLVSMELMADERAGVAEEIARVLASLEGRQEQLSGVMLEAIVAQIGAYDRPGGAILAGDVQEHCRLHVALLMRSLRAGRGPDRDDLGFAREAAARRVHQGIPLDGLLQAFRVGHRTLWQAIVDEAAPSPEGREAAIALAGEAMEYIDLASTHVAEAYLRESGQLAELTQRRRRDLLENLLAGRLPDEDETEGLGLGLERDADLLVAVASLEELDEAEDRALAQAASAIAASIGPRALVVVRQDEVVAVMPLAGKSPERIGVMLDVARMGAEREHEIRMLIGVSGVSPGLADVGRRYLDAHHALRRCNPSRPIVSLSELSPFEHLVAAADRSTRRSISLDASALTENGSGALMETLRTYLDSDLDVTATAEALFVHPNTVRYRLRRIGELTGFDPQRFSGLVELHTVARLSEPGPQ
jgi:sugar diacid utilization regulator